MRGAADKHKKTEIREKFIGEEYPIHIYTRNLEITDAIKSYALDKLSKMEHFGVRVVDALIVLDIQRGIYMVDFIIDVNNVKILATGRERDMYASIDAATGHLKSKLSRYHRHLNTLNRTKIGYFVHPGESGINPLDDINDQIEEETLHKIEAELTPHSVSKRDQVPLKILNEQEAVWKMENSADPCLMYRSEEDEKIKVIFRQHDGSYGIIEPEQE